MTKNNPMTEAHERFKSDISQSGKEHALEIVSENETMRYLVFKRPGSSVYRVNITTWPGYLCISGDMGCYVFSRLPDRFEFFRQMNPEMLDFRYIAEKTEGVAKCCGLECFSEEKVAELINGLYDQYAEENPESKDLDDLRAETDILINNITDEDSLREAMEDDETARVLDLYQAVCEGPHLKEYTFHFQWCCHAIMHVIKLYDDLKGAENVGK